MTINIYNTSFKFCLLFLGMLNQYRFLWLILGSSKESIPASLKRFSNCANYYKIIEIFHDTRKVFRVSLYCTIMERRGRVCMSEYVNEDVEQLSESNLCELCWTCELPLAGIVLIVAWTLCGGPTGTPGPTAGFFGMLGLGGMLGFWRTTRSPSNTSQ